jgi:hypothetical protein
MRESAQALAAFVRYRDMEDTRSLDAVAQQCGKSVSLLARWSAAHGWVERCRQHDQAIAAEAAESDKATRLAEMEERRKHRLRVAAILRGKAVAAVAQMTPEALAKAPGDVVRMLAQADKTERLDYGEPTQRIDVTQFTDEQLDAYIARYLADGAGAPPAASHLRLLDTGA